jgi:nucleotide-binding universal stress UspA family protein
MTISKPTAVPIKRILLATDLSPRCDRALDRAAILAAQFSAELVVTHVLEDIAWDGDEGAPSWRRPPDPLQAARRQLLRDVGVVARKATILIEQGEPAAAILRVAEREGCGLIVTGVARDELFGRFSLGATVDGLLRRSSVPLLVVKNRADRPYRHIVAATDFSTGSRHAIETAARFFPDEELTILHAYDAPMSGLMSDPDAHRRQWRKAAKKECDAFIRSMDLDLKTLIEFGDPEQLLRDYARGKDLDLVVLGTQGRGAVAEFFLGSVAKRIMAGLPTDALVVREPRAVA